MIENTVVIAASTCSNSDAFTTTTTEEAVSRLELRFDSLTLLSILDAGSGHNWGECRSLTRSAS